MKYLLLIFILSSCSASYHIKKAIQKDPSILEKDTIIFTDSVHVITEHVTHDSTFLVSKDTVIIIKDNLTMKHYFHNDSVFLWGECASDTIIRWKTFEVPTEKVVFNESWFPKWLWVLIAIICGIYLIKRFTASSTNINEPY